MASSSSLFLLCLASVCVICAHSRAVNISNTWVLPEEGFPVFYRYFRDRISWYEADAVCQFHHGSLVTVDSTSQFDAVRAYLKELDIASNVWIGLSKNGEKSRFSWANSGAQLTGDGFWAGAPGSSGESVCAAVDPGADFRWHPLNCGGPEVAAFVCELPVPPWASGDDGCMLTSLPSLTIIYLPEQTAVELTSDCGFDGTKRIACKGKADHEEMMRQLSCGLNRDEFEEKSVSKVPAQTSAAASTVKTTSKPAATRPWIWTSNTVDTGEYGFPTRHRRETEDTLSTAGGLSTVTSQVRRQTTTAASPTRPTTAKPITTTVVPKTESPVQSTSRDADPSSDMEFPSAISQGQLFSIIENGTMFDIIEMNDTSTDLYPATSNTDKPSKPTRETIVTTHVVTTAQTDRMQTTVNFYKEAPPKTKSNQSTITSVVDQSSTEEKPVSTKHAKTANDLLNIESDKTFLKAMETYPSTSNSYVKLNRTNRKELPLIDFNSTEETEEKTEKTTKEDESEHKVVEITISNFPKKTDGAKLYVTTKKYNKTKSIKKAPKVIHSFTKTNTFDVKKADGSNKNLTADYNINIEISEISSDNMTDVNSTVKESVEITIIDPKMSADSNYTVKTKTNEEITDVLLSSMDRHSHEEDLKQDEDTIEFEEAEKKDPLTTEEPVQPEPEAQPRPNRNRILTRPQRRSFYPYFFSRVLG